MVRGVLWVSSSSSLLLARLGPPPASYRSYTPPPPPPPARRKIGFSGVIVSTSTETVSCACACAPGFCLRWTRQATAARMRRVVTTEMETMRMRSVVSGPAPATPPALASDSASRSTLVSGCGAEQSGDSPRHPALSRAVTGGHCVMVTSSCRFWKLIDKCVTSQCRVILVISSFMAHKEIDF